MKSQNKILAAVGSVIILGVCFFCYQSYALRKKTESKIDAAAVIIKEDYGATKNAAKVGFQKLRQKMKDRNK